MPLFKDRMISFKKPKTFLTLINDARRYYFSKFKTNGDFNTPIADVFDKDNDVVIYPDNILGNPLGAKNIVRWYLHTPGRFTHNLATFGKNELYFKFDDGLVRDFDAPDAKLSKTILNILHIPACYKNVNNKDRAGYAYSVRKGIGKKLDSHPSDAICIDGLDHDEIAEIFNNVEFFVSYDVYSAYSTFAVISGVKSIVIPERNVSRNQWYPDIDNQLGIAYGFNDLDRAMLTVPNKLKLLEKKEEASRNNVKKFISEVQEHFVV
ncbi:hypothetical protein ACXZ7B_16275 [Vibrio owensii]|uniref:WavQ n=2 Tax=Vibrio owensii TaxID=696485 RepID=A0AAP9KBB3_9VIBR|nr:WavQ [Vibrio owensii]QGH48488.1 WavQ [Vibrio owensii]